VATRFLYHPLPARFALSLSLEVDVWVFLFYLYFLYGSRAFPTRNIPWYLGASNILR